MGYEIAIQMPSGDVSAVAAVALRVPLSKFVEKYAPVKQLFFFLKVVIVLIRVPPIADN
jgi:hypothetical protein